MSGSLLDPISASFLQFQEVGVKTIKNYELLPIYTAEKTVSGPIKMLEGIVWIVYFCHVITFRNMHVLMTWVWLLDHKPLWSQN